MVFAQHPAVATQGVLIELASLLMLTQRAQTDGEIIGQPQGDEMVIAKHAAVVGQCVLIDCCLHRSDLRDRLGPTCAPNAPTPAKPTLTNASTRRRPDIP